MFVDRAAWPFLAAATVAAGLLAALLGALWAAPALVLAAFFVFFFRDPRRTAPTEPGLVVSPADARITVAGDPPGPGAPPGQWRHVSMFLSLFDVHVNRFPISGFSTFLGYFPGKRYLTFDEKSSDYNQHNAILVRNEETSCLIRQIVGPVCRRVVYWPREDKTTIVEQGGRFGMMKFGSRLDMYFPKDDIRMVAKIGDQVTAGETIIARLVRKEK